MRVIRGEDLPFVPASHEDPRQPGVLKRVLAQRDDLLEGRVQMINWARLPAGSSFRAHYHEDMEEIFILLSGRAEMTVSGEVVEMGPGDAVSVAPQEVHAMLNVTSEDLDYIVVGISTGQGGQTIVVGDPA